MYYLFRPIKHLHPIREWALAHGAEMLIAPETFELTIRSGGRRVVLIPRFVREYEGRTIYQRDFTGDGDFIGWMPYPVKSWPLSTDKTLFKEYALANGLRVTASWTEGPALAPDYIIKPAIGSFGVGIRGPFGPLAPLSEDIALQEGNFCEQFIRGRSAKAWFWNGEPVALEVLTPPQMTGDGRRTLREIASQPRGNFDLVMNLDESTQILAWQGYQLDEVVPEGVNVMLDFRYLTPHDRVTLKNRNVWEQMPAEVTAQFCYAGPLLYRGIPDSVRRNSVFTLDAVIDDDNRVWLLEMNSHPMIHPNVYPHMLASMFDEDVLAQAEPEHQSPAESEHAA
ncbi:hypothetical protein [Achromobacter marplatensis]|uniref:hypothetical protein n=1 Tax=Achromobacter marplatensis TaxID=470868 RepID=UPI0028E32163|nr:hypothetical protein [Achromobacter marplatensis]